VKVGVMEFGLFNLMPVLVFSSSCLAVWKEKST